MEIAASNRQETESRMSGRCRGIWTCK